MIAKGSRGFGVNTHGFVDEVERATSMRTGCSANCGLVTDGAMVTSRASQADLPAGSVTRVVTPGGGVLGAVPEAAGGSAVTVAVLVGFTPPSAPSSADGHRWTTTHATRIAAATRSNHRRTYTERGRSAHSVTLTGPKRHATMDAP